MTEPNSLFKKLYDPRQFQIDVDLVVEALSEYLHRSVVDPGEAVYTPHAPDDELNFWKKLSNGSQKLPLDDLIRKVSAHSMHLHHPKYIGHQVSPVIPLAAIGGLVSDLLNNGMGVYEMGEAGTALEALIVEWISEKVGYGSQKGGFLTSGGSLANLTALLCARAKINTTSVSVENLAVFISESAHYSVERSIRILGMQPVKCKIDSNFKISIQSLDRHVSKSLSSGFQPVALVGNACTTATGTYDDLSALAAFCQQNKLWFHVDGAHGLPAIFSRKYRTLLDGIEQADSISMDFHKMMLTPALNTLLLFKDPLDSYRTYIHEAEYLFENEEEEWFNIAKRSFECTKYMMSFKIFLLKYYHGDDLFSQYIEQVFDLASEFANLIGNTPNWEIIHQPEANIICFRFTNPNFSIELLNKLNSALRKKIYEEARFYIVQTTINQTIYLRCAIMNPLTTLADCAELLANLKRHIDQLIPLHEIA